jgi:hypothetical protein
MFSAKRLLLIGFFAIILVAIPVTVYFLQQQQQVSSKAQAATSLSFSPPSTQSSPLQKNVDDVFSLDLSVDPSTNLVSFVRLEIQYDPTKLATASADGADAFVPNKAAFPSINEGPIYQDGKILVTVSVGSDPTKAIQTPTKIGTITFKALSPTDTPTLVSYGAQTQVLSIGSADQASENVLSSVSPAAIMIAGAAVTPTVTPSEVPSDTPTPTPTLEPTETPTPIATDTPTVSPVANNQLPVCTVLTAEPASGSAPLTVNFTANGNDPDGTISQVSFNFGDGQVTPVTDGLGTSTIQTQTTHIYNSGGTFTASAVLTDNSGGTSASSGTCSQTIVVDGPIATPSATPTTGVDTPTPTLGNPGPGSTIIGLGAFFTALSIIGAVLFFAL